MRADKVFAFDRLFHLVLAALHPKFQQLLGVRVVRIQYQSALRVSDDALVLRLHRIHLHRLPEPNSHHHGALGPVMRLLDGRVKKGKRVKSDLPRQTGSQFSTRPRSTVTDALGSTNVACGPPDSVLPTGGPSG